jgi:GT2 family glycosyltransferase
MANTCVQLDDLAALLDRVRTRPDARPAWLSGLQAQTTDKEDFAPYFRFLYELAREAGLSVALEVGTHKGTSAAHLAAGSGDLHVTTLDIDPAAKPATEALGLANLHAVTADSMAFVPDRHPIDLLFLDGQPTCAQVYSEYLRFRPWMRDGGLVFFDDLNLTENMKRLWPLIRDPKLRLDYLHYTGFGVARVDQQRTQYPLSPDPARILVKFPTRSRPDRFLRTLEQWRGGLSGLHDVLFLVVADADDPTMNTPAMRAKLESMGSVVFHVGRHRTKVEACNAEVGKHPFDILLLAADDMLPVAPGYDAIVARDMRERFPGLDGAIHYFDGCCQDPKLLTISVMGRSLYERFGYVYHPEYLSLFCDNEFTDAVRAWGKCHDSPDRIIRHDHIRKTPDALYKRNDTFYRDQAVYLRRRAAGFPAPGDVQRRAVPADHDAPALSVLVPALESRRDALRELLASLESQRALLRGGRPVEVLVNLDNRQKTVGKKRNELLESARGDYCVFVDDDDRVAPSYLEDILAAISGRPAADCVVFQGLITTDGANPRPFLFGKEFARDHEKNGTYYRLPNHLCPVRRELARRTRFREINRGEDSDYAARLRPLLRTQARIAKTLYFYQFSTCGTETQRSPAAPERAPATGRSPPYKIVIPSARAGNAIACVQAILRQQPGFPPGHIIVVDDGARREAEPHLPGVTWVEGVKPFVYARNANIGIRAAGTDVLLLNDDARLLTPSGFDRLSERARADPSLGVCSAGVRGVIGNANQRADVRPSWRLEGRTLVFVAVYLPHTVVERVGLLDERFTGYGYDDDDYCARAREAGLRLAVWSECVVDHSGHLPSTFRSRPDYARLFQQNRRLFADKWAAPAPVAGTSPTPASTGRAQRRVDVMYLAWNRLEFTRETFAALLANTDWASVRECFVYDDGSTDGTREWLEQHVSDVPAACHFMPTRFGSPVTAMADFIQRARAPILAKLDNDAMYPAGWLRESLDVLDRHPELALLGIEAMNPASVNPGLPRSYTPAQFISGLGLYRRAAFASSRPQSFKKYFGLEEWQVAQGSQLTRGWINPALPVFLLDRFPRDPWRALSDGYIRRGWQRPWPAYDPNCTLWHWRYPE